MGSIKPYCELFLGGWVGLGNHVGMDFLFPPHHLKLCIYTHTLRHTYISIFKKVFLPYDNRIPESCHPQVETCPVTADLVPSTYCKRLCVVPQTDRVGATGVSAHGGFAFCLKSNLLSNTVRPRGRQRLCGHHVVDDLMVPAHGGQEGVAERRPRSVSHKVSMSSASKHLSKARVQHSE